MSWFKVDDKLWGHPKWLALTPGARSLWVTAGSWCSDHLTDGEIPRHLLGILGGRSADSRKLVEIGLWKVSKNGWTFNDWADYQPSREKVHAEREAARQRQERAREIRKSRRESRDSHGVTNGVTSALVTDVSHNPDPTRPDPTVLPTEVQTARAPKVDIEPNPDFDEFYAAFPKHVEPRRARDAYLKALRRATKETILAGAQRYSKHPDVGRDGNRFIKAPASWLNSDCWADEIPGPVRQSHSGGYQTRTFGGGNGRPAVEE